MNPKIARDRFLAAVARTWGDEAAWEAGFFEDDDDTDAPLDDVDWLCTPVAHVVEATARLGDAGTPVVLVATGAFWPPHRGHVALVERARQTLLDEGVAVVGAYLSPGHDRYLQAKWGPVAPPASARISMLEASVQGVDWLAVDPWESLHRRTAVNFTDVVARTQDYLRHHVDERIEVCFVCGADNARFSLAFALDGRCVVVDRPGADAEATRWRTDPRVLQAPHVSWSEGSLEAASSTMDPTEWQCGPVPSLRLRLEDERAVRTLGLGARRWRAFQADLSALMCRGRSFLAVRTEDQPTPPPGRSTISLDPFTTGTADLGVSRIFDLGGRVALGHGARPGQPDVDQQVAGLDPGRYVLVDDDQMTGSTVAHVLASLPASVEVTDVVTLLAPADGEIADSRDFLVGTDDGGLVVRLPDGSVARAPYVLPYVDPHARCGVAPGDVLRFSAEVWRLNVRAFEGSAITIADLPGPSRRLLVLAGHGMHESVEAVCRRHAERVEALDATAR